MLGRGGLVTMTGAEGNEKHPQRISPGSRRPWIPPVEIAERREESVHILLWQVRGQADVCVEDEASELVSGHALWIPAGCRHGFTVHANSVTVPVAFGVTEVATTLRRPTRSVVDLDMRTLMLAHMVASSTIVRPGVDLARQILAMIERRPVPAGALPLPPEGPARRIAEALLFNPGDARSVEGLAASVHTSVRTVERAFLAGTGRTLRDWRIANRMEEARELLRSSAVIDAVAHRVGYTNVNSFRRVFTRHVGLSPTKYAQRYGVR